MSTENNVRIGYIRILEIQLLDLFLNPKLTHDEARVVAEARAYLRSYADELESKIEKK